MFKFRGVRYLLCLALLCTVPVGLFGDRVALAAQESGNSSPTLPPIEEQPPEEQPPPKESIELFAQFPVLENTAGASFKFEVTVEYRIRERRTFDLNLTLPPGWNGTPKSRTPEKAISAFEPEPQNMTEKLIAEVWPVDNLPEPGEYIFTFEVASGDLQGSIDLKTVVVEPALRYRLSMFVPTERTGIQAKAGEDNHMSIMIMNSASGDLEDITLSSEKPEGWEVTFTPSSLDTLEPGLSQEIDVVIKPPSGTEAGDYPVILKATSEKSDSELELRVAVLTSTAWGGIGIGIAAGVITGLIIWFRRLGKR
ncbi:MAG: hypothetical protein IMY81_00605 [Chloroflexi bacterium]|nr:hypothetical protein [Chloroflexota bacterium]